MEEPHVRTHRSPSGGNHQGEEVRVRRLGVAQLGHDHESSRAWSPAGDLRPDRGLPVRCSDAVAVLRQTTHGIPDPRGGGSDERDLIHLSRFTVAISITSS